MATLNRFPLFGLWNRIAAETLGYDADEARSIGHAVAVLFAIRARGGGRKAKAEREGAAPEAAPVERMETDDLAFGGDPIPCEFGDDGRLVRCLVGARTPQDPAQTPESYDAAVEAKIPEEYLEPLQAAMTGLLATYPQPELQTRMLYQVYDEWKRECAAGRRVDLDQLVAWLEDRAREREGR
jgi:hypothetical protein